jgi:hypothetical protein
MAEKLDRTKALAYRVWAQGLHGATDLADLDVLRVGLQDTPGGSAALGLRNRATAVDTLDRPDLVLALTVRGSPHLHRRADLPMLRAALRPHDNSMLRAYLGGYGDTLIESGVDGPKLLAEVATRMRESFPGETASKGELSGAVSPLVPEIARPWCEGCGVAHVADGLFRLATLYAGIELIPTEDRRLRFRLTAEPDEPEHDEPKHNETATTELLRNYLRLAGPALLGDLVMWLDTRSVTAPPDWLRPRFADLADELVQVKPDGANEPLYAHAETLDAMRDPPTPPPALLLPPRDTLTLGNRTFLVPDRTAAKAVWRPIGSPGTVVVAGEIAGTWRAQRQGRTLRLSINPNRTLTPKHKKAVDAQAHRVAEARNHTGKTEVLWEN